MTDFKFTFDDGSEYLMHYGKKGMRWGVWDENTQGKYASNPDLIGEFAKMLNQGGAQAQKLAFQAQNSEPAAAVKRGLMGLSRTASDAQKNASRAIGDVQKNASKEIDKFKKEASKNVKNFSKEAGKAAKTAAGMAAHPKETIINYGRYTKRMVDNGSVDRALSDAKKSVSNFAKQAHKKISSAGGNALEKGARVVDDIFGTKFSNRSKFKDAVNRGVKAGRAQKAENARQKRLHETKMKAKNQHDQEKRDRAMSAYKQRKAAEGRAKRRAADKREAFEYKDNAKREKVRHRYRKQQEGKAYVKNTTKDLRRKLGWDSNDQASKAMKAARKKSAYKRESQDNYTETGMSDKRLAKSPSTRKLYKATQYETDSLYGKHGKAAQKKAYKNRIRMYKRIGRGIASQ